MQKKIKKFIPKLIGWRLNMLYKVQPEKALQRLYKLACEPRKGRIQKEDLPLFLKDADKESLIFEGDEIIVYRWKNAGQKILLIHGWESNSSRWKEAVERLHGLGYEIIAFDAPAHGLSAGKELHVPLFARCIQAIQEKEQAHYAIGHSAGAMSIVYHAYAFTQAKSFDKVILLGAPSEMTKIIFDMAKVLSLKDSVIQSLNKFFKNKFGFYFEEFSIAQFSNHLKSNTLVIHDKYDRIAPVDAAYSISNNLEHAELIITEGQGHSLNKTSVINCYVDFIHNSKKNHQ